MKLTSETLRALDYTLECLRNDVLAKLMLEADKNLFNDAPQALLEESDDVLRAFLGKAAMSTIAALVTVLHALRAVADPDRYIEGLLWQEHCYFEDDAGEIRVAPYSDLKEAWRRIPPGRTILNALPPEDLPWEEPIDPAASSEVQ